MLKSIDIIRISYPQFIKTYRTKAQNNINKIKRFVVDKRGY